MSFKHFARRLALGAGVLAALAGPALAQTLKLGVIAPLTGAGAP